jgi:hypothetical protein
MVGHQPGHTEKPWCLQVVNTTNTNFRNYQYQHSTWIPSSTTVLDRQDVLNQQDEQDGRRRTVRNLDRHDCVAVDINADGIPDIICGVGANNGQGLGYNEVYLTNPATGQVTKVLQGHGLHRWPTMRNRFVTTLSSATDPNTTLVFFAVKGVRRYDGRSNIHRMFQLIRTTKNSHGFYFQHVPGPWNRYTTATCLHTVDINQDGLDDIVLCQQKRMGRIFVQQSNGAFYQVRYATSYAYDWRNVRVADVTGDGIPDLVVVGQSRRRRRPSTDKYYYVRVFQGIPHVPYFQFTRAGIWYERTLPHAAPDVEVLDVNQDGMADLYVVQTNEMSRDTYCGRNFNKTKWWGSNIPQPPSTFVPPPDAAQDLLLVGTGGGREERRRRRRMEEEKEDIPKFRKVPMNHAIPGCGGLVEQFGNNYTIVLSHGTFDRPGYTVLLQWW